MKARKIIAVFCLVLFSVLFVHRITEAGHHHDDADLEFCQGLEHHCYDQEDELSISSISDSDKLADFVSLLGTDLLAIIPFMIEQQEGFPHADNMFDRRTVPLPGGVPVRQAGFRAPPAVSA